MDRNLQTEPSAPLRLSVFATRSHRVAQAGLGFKVLLSLLPEFELIGIS